MFWALPIRLPVPIADYIGTEHLLAGILAEGRGLAHELLSAADVTLEKVQAAMKIR